LAYVKKKVVFWLGSFWKGNRRVLLAGMYSVIIKPESSKIAE